MSVSVANFLFELVNLLLLTAALGWFVWKPVRRAVDAERERRAAEAADNARIRAEAEAALADAHSAREAARRELADERLQLLAQARKEVEQLRERAQNAGEAARRQLEQELASMQAQQVAALSETLGRIAAASVTQLLDALDGPALDIALVRAACAQLEGMSPDVRASVLVESARPLDAVAKHMLNTALAAEWEERVLPELGAGVRVTTRAGQVDATAVALARQAARELTHSEAVSGRALAS